MIAVAFAGTPWYGSMTSVRRDVRRRTARSGPPVGAANRVSIRRPGRDRHEPGPGEVRHVVAGDVEDQVGGLAGRRLVDREDRARVGDSLIVTPLARVSPSGKLIVDVAGVGRRRRRREASRSRRAVWPVTVRLPVTAIGVGGNREAAGDLELAVHVGRERRRPARCRPAACRGRAPAPSDLNVVAACRRSGSSR